MDYTYSGVNEHTVSLAPDSMQFGRAFERLLQRIHRVDTGCGPVYISMTDIADAFMRIWLQLHSIPIMGHSCPLWREKNPWWAFP